jgi:hypothetical protein
MPGSLQQLVADNTRLYALRSDFTIWATNAVPPLKWYQITPYTGTGHPASLCMVTTEPNVDLQALYVLSSDGTVWYFDPLIRTWASELLPTP